MVIDMIFKKVNLSLPSDVRVPDKPRCIDRHLEHFPPEWLKSVFIHIAGTKQDWACVREYCQGPTLSKTRGPSVDS